jgi:phosphohistidine phosphatase SixA
LNARGGRTGRTGRNARGVFAFASALAFPFALALVATTLGCGPPQRTAVDPASAAGASAPNRCTLHSIVLVRHAEKELDDSPDPEISPKGRERALRLALLLSRSGATRLVATEFKRTQQTLEPLAERLGKPVEVRPAARTNDLVRELRDAPPGSTTVLATHANVLPAIVRELGGVSLRGLAKDGTLEDDDYSRVAVLSIGCNTQASIVELSSD